MFFAGMLLTLQLVFLLGGANVFHLRWSLYTGFHCSLEQNLGSSSKPLLSQHFRSMWLDLLPPHPPDLCCWIPEPSPWPCLDLAAPDN